MTKHQQKQQTTKPVPAPSKARQPELLVSQLDEANLAIRRAMINPGRLTTRDVMALQRTVGNHAVAQLLNRNAHADAPPTQNGPVVQTNRTVGSANDQDKQGADVDAPVRNSLIQRASEGGFVTDNDFESRLNRSKGGGAPLADNLRANFEQKFGADFGRVRTHTDSQSDLLSRSIQAKAFTTGNDIYFRKGEYNPGSSGGKKLLAHELTHTVQQGAAPIQRQPSQRVSHNLTHGGQPMQGVVQRDEIMPLEDYGDLSIPKWWQLSKRLKSKRKATPSNRMKPQEDREEVGRRLQGRKDEAREKAKKAGKPAPDELTQKTDDLGEMYAHSQMLKDFYDHTLENVAYDTGGTYNAGPIKTLGRAMDKVSTDYTDKEGVARPERVKDLLRSAIVYKNAADLAHGARRIRLLEPTIKVKNLKNKFDGTGYGDINMSLEVGDQFITELQLHLASFWEMKKQKSDHDRYEHISQLKRAKEKKGSLKPKDQSRLERLTQEHNQSYIDALHSEDDPQRAIEILKAIR